MKSFLLLFVLLGTSCFAATEKQAVDVIAIDYPPYTSPDSPGYGSSFVLLTKYAQSHLRVSLKPKFLPPARANLLIKEKSWCLSFYPPSEESTTARFVSLSANTVRLGLYRLTRAEPFQWQSLNELKGKMVALLRPKSMGKLQHSLIDAGLELVYVESVSQGLQLVLKQRVDYAFGDDLILSSSGLSKVQKQKLQFSQSAIHEAKVGFFYNLACESTLFDVDEK